jgi:hypothetical protein
MQKNDPPARTPNETATNVTNAAIRSASAFPRDIGDPGSEHATFEPRGGPLETGGRESPSMRRIV